MRIALGIEYDGTAYNGWQRQRTGRGVQHEAERALAAVASESVELVCAGRTDAGVHATHQVAHFDTTAERSERGWLLGGNSNLPDDISIRWVRFVSPDFHARYSADSRTYRYLILNGLTRSALYRHRAWWIHAPLDEQRMQQAGNHLLGEHDFSAFRASGCQARSASRRVTALSVKRYDDWLAITVTANAFLQHMVRNISGLLVAVGSGTQSPEWAGEVLASRDRTAAGPAAPPHGLTLVGVSYPDEQALPQAVVSRVLPGLP